MLSKKHNSSTYRYVKRKPCQRRYRRRYKRRNTAHCNKRRQDDNISRYQTYTPQISESSPNKINEPLKFHIEEEDLSKIEKLIRVELDRNQKKEN